MYFAIAKVLTADLNTAERFLRGARRIAKQRSAALPLSLIPPLATILEIVH